MKTLKTVVWWTLSLAMCLVCPGMAVVTMDLGDDDEE